MTTNTGPLAAQSPAPSAHPVAPTARWRLQRSENGLQLLLWADTSDALTFPMREDEGRLLAHGCDRVVSLAAPAAQGTFTPVPDPDGVAAQLEVMRYRVISPSVEAHVALVTGTAYANWMEQRTAGSAIRSLVLVFAGDIRSFLELAQAHGAVVDAGDN